MSIRNPIWRKSSYSNQSTEGDCVEVAPLAATTGVRDSKHPRRGHLEVSPESWTALLQTLKLCGAAAGPRCGAKGA
ncbi:DUF397 domain-containing protein [Yinghuangia sp. ASG 101]|uniref:DUF397 domain-containing protein n=1 Tax=Yinghuangia sp. ASG 101 TaxID=2896848 RepID=UPI001E3EF754|nr:DUF397 domain-containing protein [Yinghuangia sp. ASG 101]UGQ14815.1 DUF397 domain-containing protein [Yinghuangia sp. ASG 101]